MFSMKPEPDDYTVNIPMTFDYNGGRGENVKSKIIFTIIIAIISIILISGISMNDNNSIVKKIVLIIIILAVSTTILRFFIYKEAVYSDIYENLKEVDFTPPTSVFWKIYDIDTTYPYVCHFVNGLKGVFVRMEKDVIVGKSENVMYDHFEGISDAYNLASSMNINICHIDYMDNVGNDPRLKQMYDDLKDVDNPDMHAVLLDIYQNLKDEMSRDYSSFDTYVFFTRDKVENFIYNVQSVCSAMLGGNFVTYKILNSDEIRNFCMTLYNFTDFSAVSASESLLKGVSYGGIVPIRVTHEDGSVEVLNKTMEEKRQEQEEKLRKERDAKEEAKRRKQKEKEKKKAIKDGKLSNPYEKLDVKDDEDLDLF